MNDKSDSRDILSGEVVDSKNDSLENQSADSKAASSKKSERRIVVGATFTADLIVSPFTFWMEKLRIPARVDLVPYGQIFQSMLDPEGLLSRNSYGFNVLLLRLEDWIRDRMEDGIADNTEHLRSTARDFILAAIELRRRSGVPTLIFFAPSSSALAAPYASCIESIQASIAGDLRKLDDTHCFDAQGIERLYPVQQGEDLHADQLAHIPFTTEYFIAVATLLSRRIAALVKPPYKVITIDCDNTLWGGVCAEVGASGVEITQPYLEIQRELVRQHDAGVLLCLCSKNVQSDVDLVFKTRSEMLLTPDHFVSSRINWNPKSENIRLLSKELSLGLDSFILLDDSAVECAEVKARCPSVLTLQVPESPEGIRHLLDHTWAFDRVGVTSEARGRTAQYKSNRERARLLEQSGSLAQFIDSLKVSVLVSRMQREHLPRVAELVRRTNQFNLTGRRRNANDIEAFSTHADTTCLVTQVRDRFGDYGLVGAVLARRASAEIEVDTFVLSCRVLGRGVEYRIINEIGRIADTEGLSSVVLICRQTAQNEPARQFLNRAFKPYQLASDESPAEEIRFRIPVQYAVSVGYDRSADKHTDAEPGHHTADDPAAPSASDTCAWHEEAYRFTRPQDIARELRTAGARVASKRGAPIPPRSPLESALAEIWSDVLGLDEVGIEEHFFELGGNSLLAVQAISRIASVLKREISIYDFFERPTIGQAAKMVESACDVDDRIPAADRSGLLPLSWAQQRLWFIDHLEGGSLAYHVPVCLRLNGNLDQAALEAALEKLMGRHEVLRTVFVQDNGCPLQKILPTAKFPLLSRDLRQLPAEQREPEVLRQSNKELLAPFDLECGPLIRGQLLCLSPTEHVLLITMHHIVSDGWSVGVLTRELGALYEKQVNDVSGDLEPLPVQYADYSVWQRRSQSDEELLKSIRYWKGHLHGAPALLDLPTDRRRPPIMSYRGANVSLSLGVSVTESLRELARQLSMTEAMILHAAWAIALHRLSGQDEIVIGVPVANRQRTAIEGLIGFFVNTLAVRLSFQDDPALRDLLRRVKAVMLDSYAHQAAPFEKVVEALQPARTLSHSPLFQTAFVFHNTPKEVFSLGGLDVREQDVPLQTAQFDLTLSLRGGANDIAGVLNYATDLFDPDTMERWAEIFRSVVHEITRDRQRQVSRLPLMDQIGRWHMLERFGGNGAASTAEQLIHVPFEEHAARQPDAVAVAYEDLQLTYAELNAKANQLAKYLRSKGVGPDRLVAVCLGRGVDLVVALLAVLKAGGAYVPLDPDYPQERLAYMVEDAAPRVVVTDSASREKLAADGREVIQLDLDWEVVARYEPGDLRPKQLMLSPSNLAYVIYTSGSTGRPKGVMVEHRNVSRLLFATNCWFNFSNKDVWTLFHSFAFDFSVWELWGALSYGGRVVVVPYHTARSPDVFFELLRVEGVTVLNQTPSAFRQLIGAYECAEAKEHFLRLIIFGGEALEPAMLRPWIRGNDPARTTLVNMYGITETTVHVTYRPLTEADIECGSGSPIGKPIDDLKAYVLDRHGEPVPVGVIGELYIGGAGVTRGYLNRPALTAERFVTMPASVDSRSRVYRTGDLGRWRKDGTLEYMGRNDYQVKIRGFRIELGEIEARLIAHPQVNEAVVIIREDEPGEKRLVAYVTPASGETLTFPSAEVLRIQLKAGLPEHMIPSAFVTVDRIPLTSNGKLDVRALPAPEPGAYARGTYEPPEGEVEEILAAIWQALLRIERVGRRDNFFELGGHSLLVVQLMDRLRRLSFSVDVRRVFEAPTLADLANVLTRDAIEQYDVPVNGIPGACDAITPSMLPLVQLEAEHIGHIVQVVPGGAANIEDIYPLAPLQEGILFHYLLNENQADTYVVPTLLTISSRRRLDELVLSLQTIIDRHAVLRTGIIWDQLPRPVQVVFRKAPLQVEEVVLARDRDPLTQVKEWLNPERQTIDLRCAPLIRLRVAAETGSERWYALLQQHHIVSDNTSQAFVIAELLEELQGQGTQSFRSAVPYRNHVAQTLAYAQLHKSEEFFQAKLGDIDEPTAAFGLADVTGDGTRINEASLVLEREFVVRIRSQARSFGISAATLFHAATALVISCASGKSDVVFGTVLLGRMQGTEGSDRSLGMFINTLPLRLKLRRLSARGLVEQAQREIVELLVHEQASLAVAQRCAKVRGSAPLFNTLLNYRRASVGTGVNRIEADGINVLESHEFTNYPITLSVDEGEETISLIAQTDRRLDPARICIYVRTAVQSLIDALAGAPTTAALSLSVIPAHERFEIVHAFNATHKDFAGDKLVHELFEAQAQSTPLKTAVICGSQSLTYGELNAKANQLAGLLRSRGMGPDDLVGICVERSLEMVIAVLGVLKASAAYVPLDPAYPAGRLAYMLGNFNPRILLTQERLRARLPATTAELISVDSGRLFEGPLTGSSSPDLRPQHLAYVIYTSGSTGKPKGVMVTHAGLLNYLQWALRRYQVAEGEAVAVSSSLAFDATITSLYCPLLSGLAAVLVPERQEIDGLEELLSRDIHWSLVKIAPAHLHTLGMRYREASVPCKVGVFVVGGEALPPSTVALWQSIWPDVRLINEYGPTETVVGCSVYEVPEHWDRTMPVPIGAPLANTQIYILDRYLRIAPLGASGEIYVGGAGVARGYWGRPALTAERFLADPVDQNLPGRLYRTGDIGRWRQDGTIEYLGRNDSQVKIRGFRIELEEIEIQLAAHHAVRQARVVVREDRPGEKQLVAYVTPAAGRTIDVSDVRAYLKTVLPEYMVPSACVTLEELPLTAHGKLNQDVLPPPRTDAYATQQYESPQGDLEEIVAGVWQALLQVDRIGRNDNFFELGGHSLLIVQLMERLRRVGLTISVRSVYENPRLSDLASVLTQHVAAERFQPAPGLIPPDAHQITPDMLPLVNLDWDHIAHIVQTVPGGAENIQDIYPMVPLQEGILFHHLMNQHRGDMYVLPMLLMFPEPESLTRFIDALQKVVDRHDILRTAALWEHLPQPVQVVYRRALIPVDELTVGEGRDMLELLRASMKPECQRIPLSPAPLVRLQVAKCSKGVCYAMLQMHHLVCDHESTEIILGEVATIIDGRQAELALPHPYRNHVAQVLSDATRLDQESFFRETLGTIEDPTSPFGLSDVHGDGSSHEQDVRPIGRMLAQRVRTQSRRLGVSAATLFHVAWAVVVAATSGRDDVVFGTVLAGRLQSDAGAHRTVGMFMNTLPLRLALKDVSARQLIEQTQRSLVGLLTHEQASLSLAQRCSGLPESIPVFSALLNYRHSRMDLYEFARNVGGTLLAMQGWTNYPIVLSIDDLGEGFVLTADVDRRVSPHRVTGYMEVAIENLVGALEEAPDTPASELSVLSQSEYQRLVRGFNETTRPYPKRQLIHELFEEQVKRTPEAVAVISDERQMTYSQLDAEANRLARYLGQCGVEVGECIATLMSRSLEMLVTQLAILKRGNVYVPIDPTLPGERRSFILGDCGARCVISMGPIPPEWNGESARWIDYSGLRRILRELPGEGLSIRSEVALPAYVMYTSGSTGTPKGVVVPHHAVNRLVLNNKYADIRSTDCVAHWSNPAFDASTFEVWAPLLKGGRVLIVPQPVLLDVGRFSSLLLEQGVTVLWLTIGLFVQYAEHLGSVLAKLRYCITGGDVVEFASLKKVIDRNPPEHLLNGYGPTECTTFSTTFEIPEGADSAGIVPIGAPISNTTVYVLDARLRPVPVGVTGEICIGGEGVAIGYLRRPGITADRFIADPFCPERGGRLYRSGDLARRRDDGSIEFIGRNDQQTKIRGFRVELGEIEARLVAHEHIKECVVVAREDIRGAKRIVAYLTSDQAVPPSAAELRAHLEQVLPEYMVPGSFTFLEQLPLTANGKVDRRALPEPAAGSYASEDYEAPAGENEEVLSRVWQEILGVQRTGRSDHFFRLGGHSLSALKVLSRINAIFDCGLNIADIYKNPTLRDMASRIRGRGQEDGLVDLGQEATLEPQQLAPKASATGTCDGVILLTGATGFVGRFLLTELLRHTTGPIYCLVRAASADHALRRLRETLEYWDLWDAKHERRIVAVSGDLTLPRLGLDASAYDRIAMDAEAIYHCATSMNHLETYAMARPSNVDSAREVVKLATTARLKLVNYVSTLGVFNAGYDRVARVIDERTSIDGEKHPKSSGYAASKWVAEKIFSNAAAQGLPCNIFRLGLVWADAIQGRYDDLQREHRLFKSCLMSGYGIQSYRFDMPPTPVDYVASSIVHLANRHVDGGGVFHISSPHHWTDGLFERCNRVTEASLQLIPMYRWTREVSRLHTEGGSLPIVPLLANTFAMNEKTFSEHQRDLHAASPKIDCTRTHQELERVGIAAPRLTDGLLDAYVARLLLRDEDVRRWQRWRASPAEDRGDLLIAME